MCFQYDFKVFVEQFDDLKYLDGKRAAKEAETGETGKCSSAKAAKELTNLSRKREVLFMFRAMLTYLADTDIRFFSNIAN